MGQIPDLYEWRLSNQRLAVRLRPSAVRAIRMRPEGVLAGRRGLQDGKALILIDSAQEPKRWGAASVVGYYRAAAGHDEPTAQDRTRLANLLGDSAGVFLLVQGQEGGLEGKLFYYYGGRILRERGSISIAAERRVPGRTWTVAAASALVALAVVCMAAWYALKVQATNPEPTFNLTAHWAGAESKLRWNVESLQGLPWAKLVVSDGPVTGEYLLSRRQVLEGSFSYTPRGDDVTFRLEGADAHGHTIRESLVLARQLRPPADPPTDPQRAVRRENGPVPPVRSRRVLRRH